MTAPILPYTGPERFASLVAEFLANGGSLESVNTRRGADPWPAHRDRVRAQVDELRAEFDGARVPADRLALDWSLREKAISAAIDLIDNGQHGIVARSHGRVVGAAAITWPESGLLELQWVGTRPNVRGAGAALIAATVASWPYPTALRLQSKSNSHSFYLSVGFQDLGEAKMVLPAPRVAALIAELPRVFGLASGGVDASGPSL